MLNKSDINNITRRLIQVVIGLIILLLLAYGVSTSSFNDIKKYDAEDDKRIEMPMSKQKLKRAQERRFTTQVKISDSENIASLGDFELNIVGNKKLVANISLSFKSHKKDGWLDSKDVKQEIVTKGVVLRSSVIDTLSHFNNINVNNDKMKEQLINNMNDYLSEGEVKEVYFNEYITH